MSFGGGLRLTAGGRARALTEVMGLHDVLTLQLDAAQLLVEHPQLALHAVLLAHAALDGAAAAVEQVVLAAVAYLTLELQELLEAVAVGLVLVLQPRGAGGTVLIVSQALGQTPLDVREDVVLRALDSVSETQDSIFVMREGGAGGLVVLRSLKRRREKSNKVQVKVDKPPPPRSPAGLERWWRQARLRFSGDGVLSLRPFEVPFVAWRSSRQNRILNQDF